METKTIKKVWLSWDFKKEERWINEMMIDGWKLVKVKGFSYVFEECEPESYRYYIESLEPDDEYLEELKENNVEHVGHIGTWNYYAKKTRGYFTDFQKIGIKKGFRDYFLDGVKVFALITVLLMLGNIANMATGAGNLMAAFMISFAFIKGPGRRKELLEKDPYDITEN